MFLRHSLTLRLLVLTTAVGLSSHSPILFAQQKPSVSNAAIFLMEKRYESIDQLLQFLYKVDGNLPAVNPSKEKRLSYLYERVILGYEADDKSRKKLSDELLGDADYYIWKMKLKHQEAIQVVETFKERNNLESDLKKVDNFIEMLKSGRKQNPYDYDPFVFIQMLLLTDTKVREAIESQSDAYDALLKLNAVSKIQKTGVDGTSGYYFAAYLHKIVFSSLAQNYLDYISRKWRTK